MHHYPFHPGDYLLATCHLDPIHDLAYRRLLDYYYVEEKPIPNETDWVSKRTRLDISVIESVLREFFTPSERGWEHKRCEAEIAKYYKKADTAKSNGLKGGRPKKAISKPNGNQSGFQKETGYGSGSGSGSTEGKEVQEENHPPRVAAPCTLEQARAAADGCGVTLKESEHWWQSRASDGWMKGGEGNRRQVGPNWQSDMTAFVMGVRNNGGSRPAQRKPRIGDRPNGQPPTEAF